MSQFIRPPASILATKMLAHVPVNLLRAEARPKQAPATDKAYIGTFENLEPK